MGVFDINGNNLGGNPFLQNALVERGVFRDVQYYLVRINKKKFDGQVQYPFVIAPNGMGAAQYSALDYVSSHNYPFIINAGKFDNSSGGTKAPEGVLIINGQVLNNTPYSNWEVLTINQSGDLGYAPYDADAFELQSDGIVSALVGVGGMLINNYVGRTLEQYPHPDGWAANAQRQIIGQFGNGDYVIITAEGRNYDNTPTGWTLGDAVEFMVERNIKFAYDLDGGGSAETVVGKKQLNSIYEGTTGRKVPVFIVFNGTTSYGEPEE